MDSTLTPAATANAVTPLTLGGTARIELGTISHEPKQKFLVVCFTDGRRHWMLRCTAAQLQTFPRFQATVADQLGLWVEHHSQDSRRSLNRSRDWQDAVATAFTRGASA